MAMDGKALLANKTVSENMEKRMVSFASRIGLKNF